MTRLCVTSRYIEVLYPLDLTMATVLFSIEFLLTGKFRKAAIKYLKLHSNTCATICRS